MLTSRLYEGFQAATNGFRGNFSNAHTKTKSTSTLQPASQTAAVNGAGVDTLGDLLPTAIVHCGAVGGTTPSFTFQLQHSDDNSAFSAVADGDIAEGAQPAAVTTSNVMIALGYTGIKRYLRVAITAVSGTTPTLLCSATIAALDVP